MTVDLYMDDLHHLCCQAGKGGAVARASQDEKDRSRERIVRSGARLIRGRGLDGASVGEVMKEAGLTHGGFYRHFPTKDALVEGALEAAFEEIVGPLEARLHEQNATKVVQNFRDFYLSDAHLRASERGCPAAALAGEISRAPEATKRGFGAGVRRMVVALARGRRGADAKSAAVRDLAMLVGALAIARASDADTAELVLAACRSRAPDA